jgi:hypothetical protein
MNREGSRANLASSSTSRIKEINYIVPDRQDLLKEKLKYSWRRLIFYVFFFFLVFNVSYYPDQTKDIGSWLWVAHTLWFELDVTMRRNGFPTRALHALSFCGSWIVAAYFVVLIANNPSYIDDNAQKFNRSPTVLWLIHIWIHWLPPVWSALDLFLHYDDLRTRHRFAFKGLTGYKFYRFIGQLIWTFIAAPCLALVWYLLGHELAPAPMPWTVALPVLIGVNVVAGIAFIFLLKLPALNGETLRLLMND